MFLPSFRHLIEIEALKKQNQQNLMQISSENKRISDLVERREKTRVQIEELYQREKNLLLAETLENLAVLELRLKKLNSQLSLSVTEKEQTAFDHQILLIKTEIQKIESEYFLNLEKSETILGDIEDKKSFLDGSQKSLDEIRADVEKNILVEQTSIDNRTLRLNALVDMLHPALRSQYLEISTKFKLKSPVSFLIDKKCSECHMQADATLKSSLEEGRSFEFCPSCGRLLIPETSKIYQF